MEHFNLFVSFISHLSLFQHLNSFFDQIVAVIVLLITVAGAPRLLFLRRRILSCSNLPIFILQQAGHFTLSILHFELFAYLIAQLESWDSIHFFYLLGYRRSAVKPLADRGCYAFRS